jgi:hypothetical protein
LLARGPGGGRLQGAPRHAEQCTLACTAAQAKENPAGLDAGFSAVGSGIQGQSRQLFSVRYG